MKIRSNNGPIEHYPVVLPMSPGIRCSSDLDELGSLGEKKISDPPVQGSISYSIVLSFQQQVLVPQIVHRKMARRHNVVPLPASTRAYVRTRTVHVNTNIIVEALAWLALARHVISHGATDLLL